MTLKYQLHKQTLLRSIEYAAGMWELALIHIYQRFSTRYHTFCAIKS